MPFKKYAEPIQNLVEVYEERINNHKIFSYSKQKMMCLGYKDKKVEWTILPETFNGMHVQDNKMTFKVIVGDHVEEKRIFTYNREDLNMIQDFVRYKFPKFNY